MNERDKITCPYCGYKMPILKAKDAESKGIWVKCKGRDCGKEFEIIIKKSTDK